MKTNIRYMGFGFPIVLVGVEAMKSEDGSSFLDIPHQKLARSLFLAILLKPSPLTGAEFKFLRKYLDLTQEQFAKFIGAKSHSNVSIWENKGQQPTGMIEQAEMIARLKLAVDYSGGAVKFEDVYSNIIKTGLAKEEKKSS